MSAQKTRLLTILFFVVAVVVRFVPHPQNFTAVCALAMFAGCYLSATQGMLIGLGAMVVSDILGQVLDVDGMGFYYRPTMLAVYACSALPSLMGWAIKGRVNPINVPIAGCFSAAIFFVVTNFAVWLDVEMGYERSWNGLVACYLAAIPFAQNLLGSTLLFSGVFFGTRYLLARPVADAQVNVS